MPGRRTIPPRPEPRQPDDCPRCQGSGTVIIQGGKAVECPDCHGRGKKR